jgi:hypothetical protein
MKKERKQQERIKYKNKKEKIETHKRNNLL